jgi:hypothetical protein
MPDSKATGLIRIEVPHFVADCVIDEWDTVIRAEQALHWEVGKHELRHYCRRMGWKVLAVPEPPPAR